MKIQKTENRGQKMGLLRHHFRDRSKNQTDLSLLCRLAMTMIFLATCFLTAAPSPAMAREKGDYVIAKVGKEKINLSKIKRLARRLSPEFQQKFEEDRAWRANFIQDYVTQFALAKRAASEKYLEDPEVQFDIEHAKQKILSDRILETRLGQIAVHKEDLDAYYEKNKMMYQSPRKIKLSYLALADQKEAGEVAAQLDGGKTLDEASKKKLVAVPSWISDDAISIPGLAQFPAEELNHLFRLEEGETSRMVAAGDRFYFFHIDQRELPQDRPFEEVAKQLALDYEQEMKDKILGGFIQETFNQQDVEFLNES